MRKVADILREVTLWLCDDCGGPAVWTFIDGAAHYYCERECGGFRQMELFCDDGVPEDMRGDDTSASGADSSAPEGLPF